MQLNELYTDGRLVLSFELFPPKTDGGMETLMRSVHRLNSHRPDFFTCTYGAGGSTRARTLEVASRIRRELQIPVASHLTCVGSTRDQLRDYLQAARQAGIDYIVALRGDPPQGQDRFTAIAGGLRYANELVELIRAEFPEFGILVAGYPEVHVEAPSPDVDLQNLVRKVHAGADVVVTQLFYDNEDFLRFRDRCQAAGIRIPIVPGLLPVLSLKQVQRITSLCGAKLPPRLVELLSERDDPDWQFNVGVEHAIAQTEGLIEAGVPGLHYYVLNRSDAFDRIVQAVPHLSRS
ncbi:MAG: methylenetetrahydrofolate reductase [NAD(P)H] [Planctomycetota bacterium]|nr:MAG: methylenetetrahydrofolate reductase [NAD(P)H] [Planctomycetota bacterium]